MTLDDAASAGELFLELEWKLSSLVKLLLGLTVDDRLYSVYHQLENAAVRKFFIHKQDSRYCTYDGNLFRRVLGGYHPR